MMKLIENASLNANTLQLLSRDEVDQIYNALDCCITHEIYEKQMADIDATALATSQFSHSLMGPVFEMTLRGVLIDQDTRAEVLRDFRRKKVQVAANLNRLCSEGLGVHDLNYRSHVQLKRFFYLVMGLKSVKARNSYGKYTPTVNREAMEKLQKYWAAVPFCRHIITLRELDKKIQFLETDIDPDGRMRTSFNIAGTNTGRLSSSASDFDTGTNKQNIEHALRRVFVPDPGMKFCNIDLEQADARNVGAICWNLFVESKGESYAGSYLDACESGDLHTAVCRMAWRDLEWEDNPENYRTIADQLAYRDFTYRFMAKKLGHGTNYYGTPRTMAGHTKVATSQIASFQQRYFSAFPVLGNADHSPGDNWHSWVVEQIAQFGFITTPHFNRRRYFFGRPNDPRTIRGAIAYAPQSMTADEIDTGILQLWRANIGAQLLIQVHDSILFQYPEDREDTIIPQALELLKVPITLAKGRPFHVPLEAKIGWNWADVDPGKKLFEDGNPFGLAKWKGVACDTHRKRPTFRSGPETFEDILERGL